MPHDRELGSGLEILVKSDVDLALDESVLRRIAGSILAGEGRPANSRIGLVVVDEDEIRA